MSAHEQTSVAIKDLLKEILSTPSTLSTTNWKTTDGSLRLTSPNPMTIGFSMPEKSSVFKTIDVSHGKDEAMLNISLAPTNIIARSGGVIVSNPRPHAGYDISVMMTNKKNDGGEFWEIQVITNQNFKNTVVTHYATEAPTIDDDVISRTRALAIVDREVERLYLRKEELNLMIRSSQSNLCEQQERVLSAHKNFDDITRGQNQLIKKQLDLAIETATANGIAIMYKSSWERAKAKALKQGFVLIDEVPSDSDTTDESD